MPGPLYLRYRSDRGRPVLTELYLDGRDGEIPPGLLRRLDLAGLTATAMRGEGDWLEKSRRFAGPDLARLASHFAASWGAQAKHWVADSWRAQIKGSGVKQAPMGADPQPADMPKTPAPVQPPSGLTDDFLRSVAENYMWAVSQRQRPAPVIAAQTGYSPRSVHAWIRKARERGILPPTTKGRVG